ncbi:diaminopropionate ammonia-lyase [Kiloniella majae]|uniref:diaminopropionate ammonia-lyase n=1 Tax=Kiloniella majae TaxID=1938558 RepID=UPI000A276FF8|nr:diaminopropionate ammonia-lyase [Kiloniella majae]
MDRYLSIWKRSQFNLLPNPDASRSLTYGENLNHILSKETCKEALNEITRWPEYKISPLVSWPGLARELNLVDISFKDESKRFNLGSFKALGGAYAVYRFLKSTIEQKLAIKIESDDLRNATYRDITTELTVTTATDGNHGRSVAWGAQIFGCKATIYVPASCSVSRITAIEEFGATVIQTSLSYDETVALCAKEAEKQNAQIISDTSWDDYQDIPAQIMQGYSIIAEEALKEYFTRPFRQAIPPSHIFLQAGVGGMAAAMAGYFWAHLGERRPKIIIVEPETAACLYASAAEGTLTKATGDKETGKVHTLMAGLDCGEASPIAWEILSHGADFFMTISDTITGPTMKLIASSPFGDPVLEAGESSIAGLAALIMTATHEDTREVLGLSPDSRILLMNSEGIMDQSLYQELVVEDQSK